jgi:hypothetical protein
MPTDPEIQKAAEDFTVQLERIINEKIREALDRVKAELYEAPPTR